MKRIEEEEDVEVFVVKFALTKGIYKARGRVTKGSYPRADGTYPTWFQDDNDGFSLIYERDFARTWKEAQRRALEMQAKRIASLRRQFARIEALRFDTEPT